MLRINNKDVEKNVKEEIKKEKSLYLVIFFNCHDTCNGIICELYADEEKAKERLINLCKEEYYNNEDLEYEGDDIIEYYNEKEYICEIEEIKVQ